jgi:hypothetical protein
MLSQWKLLDNLRRSLVPAALTLLLLLGWTVLAAPLFWTLTVLGIILIPSLITSILDLLHKPNDVLLGQHLTAAGRSTGVRLSRRHLRSPACLYEAFYSLDAIAPRGGCSSRINDFEWRSSDTRGGSHEGLAASFSQCGSHWLLRQPRYPAGTFQAVHVGRAVPLLGLWYSRLYRVVDQPSARPPPGEADCRPVRFSRKLSRKTRAFLTFVGQEDNWLPPDNYQSILFRSCPSNVAHQHGPLHRIYPHTILAILFPGNS